MKLPVQVAVVIVSSLIAFNTARSGEATLLRTVFDAPQELFSTCSAFYSILKSSQPRDIEVVSALIAGVPEGRYCVSDHIDFSDTDDPRMTLLYSVANPDTGDRGFVVCVIYPYRTGKNFRIVETPLSGWVQGSRRFDAWHLKDGRWKVVLGINPAGENIAQWFRGNEKSFFNDVDDAGKVIEQRARIDGEVEERVQDALENSLERKKGFR